MGRLIVICTFWIAMALPAIALSTATSPEDIGCLCLSWFAFPYLWILTGLLAIVLVVLHRNIAAIIYVVAMLITLPYAMRVIGFYSTDDAPVESLKESPRLSIMTYNVHYMGFATDEIDAETSRDSLAAFVERIDADVLCMQEVINLNFFEAYGPMQIRKAMEEYPYRLFSMSVNGNEFTFSRYPIEAVPDSVALGTNGILHGVLTCDITLENGTKARIFNCHLASLGLSKEQVGSVLSKDVTKERARTLHSTYSSLMSAFCARAVEVRALCRAIENSPYPVIVCGDFNDIPTSYTYHKMSHARPYGDDGSALKEAYKPGKIGLARTYRGALPPIRIDYLWTSESLKTASYKEHDLVCSDHKAITCEVFY